MAAPASRRWLREEIEANATVEPLT